MTIVTRRGDTGMTDLAGQVRTSKSSLRVECYGEVDELIAQLGVARSACPDAGVRAAVKGIQRTLFRVGSAIATAPGSSAIPPEIGDDLLESLDSEIRTIESGGSVRADWSVPGEDAAAAAMDLARAVCRRAERHAVGLAASGEPVAPNTIRYLNRLSDLLWLFSRQLESAAGVDGALRDADDPGKPWSPAW